MPNTSIKLQSGFKYQIWKFIAWSLKEKLILRLFLPLGSLSTDFFSFLRQIRVGYQATEYLQQGYKVYSQGKSKSKAAPGPNLPLPSAMFSKF